jgi:RNase P protein component
MGLYQDGKPRHGTQMLLDGETHSLKNFRLLLLASKALDNQGVVRN